MHSTLLRLQHIHGLMVGVAIGDALGFCREGLRRRVALQMFGRPPLKYRLLPGRGICSDDTHLMFIAAQSIVQCRSDLRSFRRVYQARLSWYLLSLPVGIGRATALAAAKCWFARLGLPTGSQSAGNGGATRAMFCALALHNNGHRLRKWVEEITRVTHTHRLAIDGCQILAQATETAATTAVDRLEPLEVLRQAIEQSTEPEFREGLTRLLPWLAEKRSPSYVARQFGWHYGISGFIVPTTIMALYCWLRYPQDFRRAVESAICLGGDSDSVGAIVGGLAGAHLGIKRIPNELVQRLKGFPQSTEWIAEMAQRLADWPHGVHDLSIAPPQPSEPVLQLMRNLFTFALVMIHVCLRIPFWLHTRSRPASLRLRPGSRRPAKQVSTHTPGTEAN